MTIPAVVRSGKQPHEVWLMVVFAIVGVVGLFDPAGSANRIIRELPTWGIFTFYGCLAVGSIATLYGVFTKGIKGPIIEMMGLASLSFQLFGYGIAVWSLFGLPGLLSAILPFGVGVANIARIRQILKELRAAEIGRAATRVEDEG